MLIALVADTYPPLRSSGAVQLRDLSREFARQGHKISVLVSSPGLGQNFLVESFDGVQVVRLRTLKTKDVGYIRRTLAELLMPFVMMWNLKKSPLRHQVWDAVVWYSPSIFLGPIVSALKKKSKCKSYLIVRDIFPEWALDMGLMRKGPAYYFFKLIAQYQNSVADVIGIQTQGNQVYFEGWVKKPHRRLEVLHNWLSLSGGDACSISINQSNLANKKIFVYAGNMGVAQGIHVILDLIEAMRERKDIGFLFVGRGSELAKIKARVTSRGLDNVAIHDEIHPDEIPVLYSQCDVGIVSLDERHKTHNIPGKFLSYMGASLPVLAIVNEGNDLVGLIDEHQVGMACTQRNVDSLKIAAESILDELLTDAQLKDRCEALARGMFSTERAVKQIVAALK